jgi:putative salt-induced outer membrane protein YdiY
MYRRIIIGFLLIVGWWQAACADELVFKNGDKLNGKVIQFVDGKLVFDSNVAGSIKVDLSKIQTFKTDKAVEVNLTDGTSFNQVILEANPGFFTIMGSETLKGQEIALDKIASINPPKKPEPRWTGDISAGITATRGNTVTDTSNLSVNLMRRTEKDRSLLSGYYIRGKQKDPVSGEDVITEDNWWIRGKYDYFITKKFFVYGDGRYERDAIAKLDRRVIIGGGGGYQWIESDNTNFSTEAGLASLYEKYTNNSDSKSDLSAQLGYHFDKKLHSQIKFLNDLTYYPSLEKLSDFFLTTTAEIRFSVTEQIFTNFKVIYNYNTTPAEGTGKTDVKYLLGVGLKF